MHRTNNVVMYSPLKYVIYYAMPWPDISTCSRCVRLKQCYVCNRLRCLCLFPELTSGILHEKVPV